MGLSRLAQHPGDRLAFLRLNHARNAFSGACAEQGPFHPHLNWPVKGSLLRLPLAKGLASIGRHGGPFGPHAWATCGFRSFGRGRCGASLRSDVTRLTRFPLARSKPIAGERRPPQPPRPTVRPHSHGHILSRRDAGGLPFAIVDKGAATLQVYRANGQLVGSTPVLLGQTPGDRSAPGVGERTERGQLRSDDRTTPAGRFTSEPGRNRAGEAVVWIDYASAFAIHRLRPGPRANAAHSASPRRTRPNAASRTAAWSCRCCSTRPSSSPCSASGRGVVYVMAEDEPTLLPWAAL